MKSRAADAQGLQAICNEGLALHRAGRLAEARERYNWVLQRDPGHFEALRLLGVLCLQAGQAEQAAAALKRAVGVRPDVAEAHSLLGGALSSLARPAEALASYEQAIALNPTLAGAHYNRAIMLQALGRSMDALAGYDRAIALNPSHTSAHYNRGVLLHALGRPAEALASYDAAIALDPGVAEDHYNRGLVLSELARPEEALASYDRALALKPTYSAAHNNRGAALSALKRHEEALASYDTAIAFAPDDAEAHNNRAAALLKLQRPEEGVASCDRAIALRPALAEAHNNRGSALCELTRIDEALASFDAAITLAPEFANAHVNRSFALLVSGRFEAGWREHEWRKRQRPAADQFDPGRPWLGEPDLAGQRLFVRHEQGLGDTLQFSRYVPLLERAGADVILSVQDSLKPLLRQVSPTTRVIGEGEQPPPFDYHCSLLSLPLAFGTTLETIPPPAGRLVPDPERRARFAARLGPRTRPRIGVVWSGSPTHVNDHNRSIAFEQLAPLFAEDLDWVALHKEVRAGDTAALEAGGRVSFHGDELSDFADTAALLDLMDLVVTVDTSVAHLAGAMGKPVWILLPFCPDWRWLLGRADSPWHPSARLFRQRRIGDWTGVVDEVVDELRSLAG